MSHTRQYLSERAINNTVKLVKLYLRSRPHDSRLLPAVVAVAGGRLAVQLQERSFRKIWPTISSCSAPGIRGNKFMRSINLGSAKTQDHRLRCSLLPLVLNRPPVRSLSRRGRVSLRACVCIFLNCKFLQSSQDVLMSSISADSADSGFDLVLYMVAPLPPPCSVPPPTARARLTDGDGPQLYNWNCRLLAPNGATARSGL